MKKEETTAINTEKSMEGNEDFVEVKIMDKKYVEDSIRRSNPTRAKMLDTFLKLCPQYQFNTFEENGINFGYDFYESRKCSFLNEYNVITLSGEYAEINIGLEINKFKPLASKEDSLDDKILNVDLILDPNMGPALTINENGLIEANHESLDDNLQFRKERVIQSLEQTKQMYTLALEMYDKIFNK